jgi:protein-disulfide isomerase
MNPTPLPDQLKKTRRALREESRAISRSRTITLLIPIAFGLGLFAGYLIWGRSIAAVASGITDGTPAASQTPQKVTRYQVDEGGNPAIGPKNAPITMIEFSDYQCPYCLKWNSEVYQRLLKAYPDKIRFVYRDFPLTSIHPEAEAAAEAADCAGAQGRYFDYHDKLFSGELELGSKAYIQYANELGLNETKFNDCMSNHLYKDEVNADFQYAANLGVRSTPTFFINGIALIGAQPYEAFQQVIDKELSAQNQ